MMITERAGRGGPKNPRTILCVGPTGVPLTGQALATETWTTRSISQVIAVNNNFEGKTRLARFSYSLALPLRVLSACWRKKPDAMYLSMKRSKFGMLTDLFAVLAYRSTSRGPVIVHLHGADLALALNSYFTGQVAHLLWRSVTDVIILSPRMKEQLQSLPPRRIHVVGNFSEMFATPVAVEEKVATLGKRTMHVVYLSNIMYSKGFLYLIEAVKMLQDEGRRVHLSLAGQALNDHWMTAVEAQEALKMGLSIGIRYLGIVSGDAKRELLSIADVLVLPTFYPTEAQPISLIEGMAFGAVPLTTRHNYNEDYLDLRAALFVEKKSTSAIANALRQLLDDPIDHIARIRIAHSIALEKYDTRTFVQAIDNIISAALKDKDLPL
jgi:glycosyltransferase involved in cell wall biosynthesis